WGFREIGSPCSFSPRPVRRPEGCCPFCLFSPPAVFAARTGPCGPADPVSGTYTDRTGARSGRSSTARKEGRGVKVRIVYYSTYGNVFQMAKLVAEGVQAVAGAEAVLRTVPELIPQTVIDSRPDMKAGRDAQRGVPLVTADDFREAGAYAFGTPTRF